MIRRILAVVLPILVAVAVPAAPASAQGAVLGDEAAGDLRYRIDDQGHRIEDGVAVEVDG